MSLDTYLEISAGDSTNTRSISEIKKNKCCGYVLTKIRIVTPQKNVMDANTNSLLSTKNRNRAKCESIEDTLNCTARRSMVAFK
jgi:hypothetical protein